MNSPQRLACLLLLASLPAAADTFRCGNQLVSTGERSFEIRRKCGEPVYREVIGYTLGPRQRPESVIEEWIYASNNGMTHSLRLEGNRLVSVESRHLP